MEFRDGEDLPPEHDIIRIFADGDTRGLIATEAIEDSRKRATNRSDRLIERSFGRPAGRGRPAIVCTVHIYDIRGIYISGLEAIVDVHVPRGALRRCTVSAHSFEPVRFVLEPNELERKPRG